MVILTSVVLISLGVGIPRSVMAEPSRLCAADAPAWLTVYFNGHRLGDALGRRFPERSGLWLEATALERERALLDAVRLSRKTDAGVFASLNSIAGLHSECDAHTGRLDLRMVITDAPLQRLRMGRSAPRAPLDSGVGARLDYNLFARTALNDTDNADLSLLLDGLGFAGPVRLRNAALGQRRDASTFSRLDTTLEWDWLRADSQWQLGDFISSPDALGQRFRMGGISLRRAFEFRPLENTFPVPVIQGTAVLPSTLDLFIDGVRRGRFEVDEGDFTIADAPPLSGSGTAEVIVTNILGEQQRLSQPFFVVEDLLRPGLWDYAIGLGVQREEFGIGWGRYDTPQMTAETRMGVNDLVTLEARGRLIEDGHNAEAGLLARLPWWPVRAGATIGHYALPDGARGMLHQWRLGARYGRAFADASERRTHPEAGTPTEALPYGVQRRAQLGVNVSGWSVIASYLHDDSARGDLRTTNLRIARSFNFLFGASLALTVFTRELDGDRSEGGFLTASWSPARRHSLIANVSDDGAGQIQYFRQRASELGQQ
ncbi:MAG: fimbria/pilus outer membrane usher protein, partial [Oceanococcaceae bacterium]